MLNRDQADDIMAATAYDQSGEKVGSVDRLFLDDATGEPAWVSVRSGLFGTKERFVPLTGAELREGQLVVSVPHDKVKDSPSVDLTDGRLSEEQSDQLHDYYGMTRGTGSPGVGSDDAAPGGYGADAPSSYGPGTPPADDGDREESAPYSIGPDSSTTPDTAETPVGSGAPQGYDPPADDHPPLGYDPPSPEDHPLGYEPPPPPVAAAPNATTPPPAAYDAPPPPSPSAYDAPPTVDAPPSDAGPAGPTASEGDEQHGLRLRRKVVVEEQTITVPVVREEYVLEGEPELNEARDQPPPTT